MSTMHQVLRQLLARIQDEILRHPKRVLFVSFLLFVVALFLGSGVEFRSSRSELVPADDPDQQRWSALLDEYGGTEPLIVCVEAAPGEDRGPIELAWFVDRLAAELRRDPLVEHVYHRFDIDWVLSRAIHLVSGDALSSAVGAISAEPGLVRDLKRVGSLADLNHALAARLERGLSSETDLPAEGAQTTRRLVDLLRLQREFLEDPAAMTERLVATPPFLRAGPGATGSIPDGYLKTHDGETYFLLISPRAVVQGLQQRRALIKAMRERADRVRNLRQGFHVAFTGPPAMVVEEMDTVRADTWRTSLVAVIGVSVLTFLVFRWRTHALLVLTTLAVGLIWAFGAVRLELGYLNMITSSFISTLVGVGVAYGIHPVSEYELNGAHTNVPEPTIRESLRRTGAGVAVAGITTAAAFFSILLIRFRGFSELGLVAGVGVLLCLAAALISLPALLVVYSRWRRRRDLGKPHRAAPMMDLLWVKRISNQVCRFPRVVTLLALALTALAAWSALDLRFDTNIFDLLPRNSEALRYQHKMVLESDLSPLFSTVVADDLESLREMERRAGEEAAVQRFESVGRFLPAAEQSGGTELDTLRTMLDEVQLDGAQTRLERDELVAALVRLEQALAQTTEAAFVTGMGELAGALEQGRAEVERSVGLVRDGTAQSLDDWNRGQDRLARWARAVLDWGRSALATEPPTLEGLPAEIRERFLTRSGRPLGLLYPAADLFDADNLDRFVEASRRVSPLATGFPVVFHKMSLRITSGFYRAVGVGALVVTLILLIDYRHPRDALLALVPLILGVVWMMGAMRLFGIHFNYANLVAVPLIIGVGIDNGVHVIHRVRYEGRAGMSVVLSHTGRAILIASMTTMIGFGSLALASHRGMASLGIVLLLGVGSCMITSTWVLPNLLVALGLVDR
jgi:hopanoid biosynthesis associated RND transporter like protein HpnN